MKKSKISQNILITILIADLIASGYFAYQWWQVRKELKGAATQIEKLLNQINIQINKIKELEKEIKELKKTDETANWKTYRNEEYGFEVKYPEKWTYKEDSYSLNSSKKINRITFGNFPNMFTIEICPIPYETSLKLLVPGIFHEALPREIVVNNVKGAYREGGDPGEDIISIWLPDPNNDDRSYILTFEQSKDQNYQEIFDQILSTFKFINHE